MVSESLQSKYKLTKQCSTILFLSVTLLKLYILQTPLCGYYYQLYHNTEQYTVIATYELLYCVR